MKYQKIVKILFMTLIVLALSLSSCKEFSNESSENSEEKTLSVDIGNISQQLNDSKSSQNIVGTGDAKGLAIGAFVITTRDTPYTSGETLTEEEEEDLINDIANSINYITLANLPVNAEYIDFLIPPKTAAHWQVVVVAVDTTISRLADLDGAEITHTGFSTQFFTTDTLGSEEIIEINMADYVEP